VRHPEDVLGVGQEVKVKVIELDEKRQRIGLSIRRLLPNPWEDADKRYFPGQTVDVTITNLADFGAFAQLEQGLEGLIHISRLAYNNVGHPRDVLSVGEEVQAVILHIDMKRKRLALSMREVIQWVEASDAEDEDAVDVASEPPQEQPGTQGSGANPFSADLPDHVVAGLIFTQ
jgi:small subunit ribosomal protein S1